MASVSAMTRSSSATRTFGFFTFSGIVSYSEYRYIVVDSGLRRAAIFAVSGEWTAKQAFRLHNKDFPTVVPPRSSVSSRFFKKKPPDTEIERARKLEDSSRRMIPCGERLAKLCIRILPIP
jgi:hypothetical protein